MVAGCAMNLVTLFKEKSGKVTAVLARDPKNYCFFSGHTNAFLPRILKTFEKKIADHLLENRLENPP
jgi:hypothetical protein